ncbi:MAG: arginine repressor, partial [Eubacterium sp.]|nr:arginine repressor [Eubacterium sp.]
VSTPGGKQKYTQLKEEKTVMIDKFHRIFKEGVVRLDTAQNILVIKTVSGMAMAVAAALDEMGWPQIVGSIAGDDTIMCAVKTNEDAQDLLRQLNKVIKEG